MLRLRLPTLPAFRAPARASARSYSTSYSPSKSDLPWALTSAIIFLPLAFYLTSASRSHPHSHVAITSSIPGKLPEPSGERRPITTQEDKEDEVEAAPKAFQTSQEDRAKGTPKAKMAAKLKQLPPAHRSLTPHPARRSVRLNVQEVLFGVELAARQELIRLLGLQDKDATPAEGVVEGGRPNKVTPNAGDV